MNVAELGRLGIQIEGFVQRVYCKHASNQAGITSVDHRREWKVPGACNLEIPRERGMSFDGAVEQVLRSAWSKYVLGYLLAATLDPFKETVGLR